ncbi:MAG: alpha/beta fold hydrolase [Bradyrhizobiaceae bacterium]|nr:alpha/beta fold hydrolase [Bradyrhizobiaceae bacterium]
MRFLFEGCALDTDRRELHRGGVPQSVEPQVFDLLVYLIRNRDRVVSRDDLLANVWNGRIVSESTLATRINAARKAVGDDGERQRLIRTVQRRGVRFVGSVREDAGLSEKGEAPAASAQSAAPVRKQQVSFCRTGDGVRIAVASVGEGPPLVKTANWLTHLEYDWESPLWSPMLHRLADRARFIRYDGRGTGLSDRTPADISFSGFVHDLKSVVDSMQLDKFALFGSSQGAATAIAYAARHPERVSKLVLCGGYAQGRNRRESPADAEVAQAFLSIMRHGWGDEHSAFMRAFSSVYIPGASPEQIKWFADLQRITTSAEAVVRLRNACDDIDVVDLLPSVRAPTLVLHARRDNVASFEQGRLIAASIPNARLVSLEGENHIILPAEPAWHVLMQEIEAFLRE